MIGEMKQIRKDATNYEVYYHHPFTNQMWKSFFPKADGKDLGPKLLRHEPPPTSIEESLNICLSEDEPENAIGLGIEWSAKPHLWPEIIQALENRYAHYDRTQLKLFLNHLNMDKSKEAESEKTIKKETTQVTAEKIGDLIWRSRKIRMKRFFVFG